MKAKGCLTAIGLLILLLLIVSFFMPASMDLEVNKKLESSPEQVFAQVNDLKQWENWSMWAKMDPEAKNTYTEKTTGIGAKHTWDGKKVKKGSQEIIESETNKMIRTKLLFDGYEDPAYANLTISPDEDGGSNVTWDLESGESSMLPWKRFSNMIGKMMVTKSYNKGLEALDAYVKANPDAHISSSAKGNTSIPIEEVVIEKFNAITSSYKGKWSEFGPEPYEKGFAAASEAVEKAGAEIVGMPFAQWIEWDTIADKYELLLGIPVKEGGESFGGKKTIKASYYGPYENMDVAYSALIAYGDAKGYELGMPIEIFVNDPTTVQDPNEILTEIYFPIEN